MADLSSRQLRAVLTIAEKANISRAAVELSMSQPALSRSINQIEKALGVQLFDRSSAGVQLTEAGRRVCSHAEQILRHQEAIAGVANELDGQLAGDICIALPESVGSFIFLHLLKRFKEQHPHVALRVLLSRTAIIPHYMDIGTADVAIVDEQGLKGLAATPLMSEQMYLIGPPSTKARTLTRVNFRDMASLPLLLPALEGSMRTYVDRAFAEQGLQAIASVEIDSPSALLELVQEGEGYAVMPYAGVHRMVQKGEITARLITNPAIERMFWTAVPGNRPVTQLMRGVETELRKLITQHRKTARWRPVVS